MTNETGTLPMAFDSIHADLVPQLGPLAGPVVAGGDCDVVLIAVPRGNGQAIAALLADRFKVEVLPDDDPLSYANTKVGG